MERATKEARKKRGGCTAIETLATKKPLKPSYIFVNNRLEGSALGTITGGLGQLPPK